MDFGLSEEQELFRYEVQDFIKRERPADEAILGESQWDSDEADGLRRTIAQKLGQKGWLTLSWPEEYGGKGIAGLLNSIILYEEMFHAGLPGIDNFGLSMLAPVLMRYGTEEQKRKHLPPMARGEVFWCEGFSEPNAGSDLGSLQTRAVEDGDSFILNGQKIWVTGAHRADWGFFLCRTDQNAPKHRGISFFLMDMKSPGITIRPIMNMAGAYDFCEIFLDNVRVARENLVGEKNDGWRLSMALLDAERSSLFLLVGIAKRALDYLIRHIREKGSEGLLRENSLWRHRLAEIAIKIDIARLLGYQALWLQSKGLSSTTEASMAKVFGSELLQQIANANMELLGLYGQLIKGSKWAFSNGVAAHSYLNSFSHSILGGTSEIQRNLIATMGLQLPRH